MSWFQFIEQILPFVAIQLYIFCLIYLVVARKRFATCFTPLALFLSAVILFLSCYLADNLITELSSLALIQIRMTLLFAIGFPSLTLASAALCQSPLSKQQAASLYGLGLLTAGAYAFFLAVGWHAHFGSHNIYLPSLFPKWENGFILSKVIAASTTIGFVLMPCGLKLYAYKQRDLKTQAFLASAILFALLFAIGILSNQWWVYYLGSILCASIFLSAVYLDIHHLNQTASFIKDALRQQVLSGKTDSHDRLVELIDSLENSSDGNLEVYKMRIGEVLSMIADDAIESGGDVEALLKRNQENFTKIEQAEDMEALSKVTEHEAQELAEIITKIPHQRRVQVINEIKEFITENLDQDLKINTIASEFHVSKSYLTNGFKEVEGETLNQYISKVRIEKAQELLKTQSVTETAFDVGFSNSNYFATVFKKLTGQTPKEYQDHL